ncbi:MAG: hypothetical protein IJ906_04255 [Oscillospiraceae bacterium]|nr:hypothetical protein [Oscillospiraceae bacterium]
MSFIIGLILACIIAGIVVGIQWSELKSVAAQNRADSYVQKNSLNLRTKDDKFLYTKTEKKERPKQTPSQS